MKKRDDEAQMSLALELRSLEARSQSPVKPVLSLVARSNVEPQRQLSPDADVKAKAISKIIDYSKGLGW